MPFGLSTAPQTFTRAISKLLEGIKNIFVYIDDTIVATSDIKSHHDTLKEVFNRLTANFIQRNMEKSEFLKKEISFLDHIISQNTVKADLSTFDEFKIAKQPINQKELKSLLGYINFFRPYIQNLSTLIIPITDKLRQKGFSWTAEDQKIIKSVAEMINRNQELVIPKPNYDFQLYTDASLYAIAGVLTQENKTCKLFSRKLNAAEISYSIVEKEELAIIASLEKFKPIIGLAKVVVFTDNKNITFTESKSERAKRWRNRLSEFAVKIQHISGKENTAADYLSRNLLILPNPSVDYERIEQLASELQPHSWKVIKGRKLPFDPKDRFIVPEGYVNDFLTIMHLHMGHTGTRKIQETLQEFFWFSNFYKRISDFTSSCLECAKNKHSYTKKGKLYGYLESNNPKSKLSTDLLGPLPGSDFGLSECFYVLTITDIFTRYTVLVH